RVSFSPPDICRDIGLSFSSMYSIFIVFSLPNKSALSLIISAHTRPAPNSFTVNLNAALLTPAIGARTTRFSISTSPILKMLLASFQIFFSFYYQLIQSRMFYSRCNFCKRFQYKAAQMHLFMRDGEIVKLELQIFIKKNIYIYDSRSPYFFSHSSQRMFYSQHRLKKTERRH